MMTTAGGHSVICRPIHCFVFVLILVCLLSSVHADDDDGTN